MLYRIGFNLFIAASLVYLPWQSYVLFIAAGFFLYDNYYEGIMWGMMIDAVSGTQTSMMWWYTIYTVVLFGVVGWSKKYLRFYD